MRVAGFFWLEEVVEKLESKHGVSAEEVEELFVSSRSPRIRRIKKGHFHGEDVYRALGRTGSGRYLVVFFILKVTGEVLVLSSRDMDGKERKSYAKQI